MQNLKNAKKATPQKNITLGIIATSVIVVSVVLGYLIFNQRLDRTSQFGMEDIAPDKSDEFIIKVEDLEAEMKKETASQNDIPEKKKPVKNEIAQEKLDNMKLPDQSTVIYFKSNPNEISDQAYKSLKQVVHILTKHPELEIIVEGYTDSTGNDAYNFELSEFRAAVVKNYLVSKGINPRKITVVGLGAQNFIAPNDTAQGRSQNRRVEIKVVSSR